MRLLNQTFNSLHISVQDEDYFTPKVSRYHFFKKPDPTRTTIITGNVEKDKINRTISFQTYHFVYQLVQSLLFENNLKDNLENLLESIQKNTLYLPTLYNVILGEYAVNDIVDTFIDNENDKESFISFIEEHKKNLLTLYKFTKVFKEKVKNLPDLKAINIDSACYHEYLTHPLLCKIFNGILINNTRFGVCIDEDEKDEHIKLANTFESMVEKYLDKYQIRILTDLTVNKIDQGLLETDKEIAAEITVLVSNVNLFFNALLDEMIKKFELEFHPTNYPLIKEYVPLLSQSLIIYELIAKSETFHLATKTNALSVHVEGPDRVGKDKIAILLRKKLEDLIAPYAEDSYDKHVIEKYYPSANERVNSMRSSFERSNYLGHMAKHGSTDLINSLQTRQTLNAFNSMFEQCKHKADSILNYGSNVEGLVVENRSPLSSFVYYISSLSDEKIAENCGIKNYLKTSLYGKSEKESDNFLYELYLYILHSMFHMKPVMNDNFLSPAITDYISHVNLIIRSAQPFARSNNMGDYFEKQNNETKTWQKRSKAYEGLYEYLKDEYQPVLLINNDTILDEDEFDQFVSNIAVKVLLYNLYYNRKYFKRI